METNKNNSNTNTKIMTDLNSTRSKFSSNKLTEVDINDNIRNVKFSDDDVKVFLKLKKVEVPDDKLFYKIFENKKKFSLFDPIRRVDSDKSTVIEVDKIFTDEEHSYVYEEVCRDVIKEALSGKSFCFMTYGLTHTGKKSIMFGGKDCVTNINSRGIFLRLLQNLNKTLQSSKTYADISLTLSFFAVNKNRYLDLSNLNGKRILDLTELEIDSEFKKINKTIEFSSLLKKLPVDSDVDITDITHFYSQLMGLFYKLEACKQRLYSRTHFMFVIRIGDNQGRNISNLLFSLLAGSEMLAMEANILNSPNSSNNLSKPEEAIYIQSSFLNLITCISTLKKQDSAGHGAGNLKFKEIPFDEFTLTYCLKTFLSSPGVKYRIIGCTQPNTGYYDSVKDTLLFLLKCKKSSHLENSKKSLKKDQKPPEQIRDEVLYELENKIRTQEKTISKLNENIMSLNKKIEQNEVNYKKNLEIIKNSFGFEGDINKLTLNDEYLKESKYARNIKESFERVKYLNKRIVDYEKKYEELQEENKKILLEKRIVENDKVMVTLFSKLKEDNLHEENKIKILLANSKDLDEYKKENEQLKKQIEGFKKDLDEKNKFIHNLPSLLNGKIENNKNFSLNKEELKNELERKYKSNLGNSNSNFKEEMKITVRNYESVIKQKNDENFSHKTELKEINMINENKIKEYKEELVKIYEKINLITEDYKNNYDFLKKLGKGEFNIANSSNFLLHLQKAKENFEKTLENATSNIIKSNFPLLLKEWDVYNNNHNGKNKNSNNYNNIYKTSESLKKKKIISIPPSSRNSIHEKEPVNIKKSRHLSLSASDISEEIEKVKFDTSYNKEDLDKMEKANLRGIILELQQGIKEFKILFEKVKKKKRGYDSDDSLDNKEYGMKLKLENEKMKRKIEELVKVANGNKITIGSQGRLIDKLSIGNFMNKKLNANKEAENKIPALKLNTANNFYTNFKPQSSPIKNIMGRNSSMANFNVRPHTGKLTK